MNVLGTLLELIYACRVFVNGRPRPVIMEDMRKRIARGDVNAERRDAIKVRATWRISLIAVLIRRAQAMCDIAADRARKLLGPAP